MVLLPDEPADEYSIKPLPNEGDTPFRPADDIGTSDPYEDLQPATDTDMDEDEQYQEGTAAASTGRDPLEHRDESGFVDEKDDQTKGKL